MCRQRHDFLLSANLSSTPLAFWLVSSTPTVLDSRVYQLFFFYMAKILEVEDCGERQRRHGRGEGAGDELRPRLACPSPSCKFLKICYTLRPQPKDNYLLAAGKSVGCDPTTPWTRCSLMTMLTLCRRILLERLQATTLALWISHASQSRCTNRYHQQSMEGN